jgi:hypothetical protein
MDKVHKHNSINTNTPSSEFYRGNWYGRPALNFVKPFSFRISSVNFKDHCT